MRVALGRFDVKEQPIKRVLQVTHSLYRRTAESPTSAQERNIILSAILEILSDGLRGKGRISNVTMKAVVDVRRPPEHPVKQILTKIAGLIDRYTLIPNA